ncbi:WYL domain-containing protein [Paenibacillus sp. FSL K6-0276]|uniref:WYL domain-containing protein n=1 Tax=Paenibacillus sp. FSL K6-0276 TaxID=2921450 RepID=UPI0030EBF975
MSEAKHQVAAIVLMLWIEEGDLDHSILDRMLDYCGEENITPLGNGEFYAYLDFIEDDYGYGILMSFGDKCQCIEPEHVRNEMKRRLKDSIRAYL